MNAESEPQRTRESPSAQLSLVTGFFRFLSSFCRKTREGAHEIRLIYPVGSLLPVRVCPDDTGSFTGDIFSFMQRPHRCTFFLSALCLTVRRYAARKFRGRQKVKTTYLLWFHPVPITATLFRVAVPNYNLPKVNIAIKCEASDTPS